MIYFDDNISNIMEEQYQLARKINISVSESNMLPIFEMESYVDMLIKELNQEKENLKL